MQVSKIVAVIAAILCGSTHLCLLPAAEGGMPAFPGAEGFGAYTVGGRGGRVIQVVNLNDSGPGSLREAIEAPGPRIVVFRVGGTIELKSSLTIIEPYITIAGQTAPGGGITLRNGPRNPKTPLKIETHDVVVRYLRSRPGANLLESGTLDAITIASKRKQTVYNVVVDHGSFSWATDEVANIYYDARNVTVQWSIIAEGLDCATHIELGQRQCHSMGMLVGSEESENFSLHHNLFAHNRHRNPKIRTAGTADVVNNVVYNSGFGKGWRSPTYVDGGNGVVPANYINNYFKPGADTGSADWFLDTKERVRLYAAGNIVAKGVVHPDPQDLANLVYQAHPAPAVTTWPAEEAFWRVVAGVGADIGLNCDGTTYTRRDAVDVRIVNDVVRGTGRIIDNPLHVGGWPEIESGTPCPDADKDGMPDEWESENGLDPNDPTDGNSTAPSGYTWVEEYLNPPFPADDSENVEAPTRRRQAAPSRSRRPLN